MVGLTTMMVLQATPMPDTQLDLMPKSSQGLKHGMHGYNTNVEN